MQSVPLAYLTKSLQSILCNAQPLSASSGMPVATAVESIWRTTQCAAQAISFIQPSDATHNSSRRRCRLCSARQQSPSTTCKTPPLLIPCKATLDAGDQSVDCYSSASTPSRTRAPRLASVLLVHILSRHVLHHVLMSCVMGRRQVLHVYLKLLHAKVGLDTAVETAWEDTGWEKLLSPRSR